MPSAPTGAGEEIRPNWRRAAGQKNKRGVHPHDWKGAGPSGGEEGGGNASSGFVSPTPWPSTAADARPLAARWAAVEGAAEGGMWTGQRRLAVGQPMNGGRVLAYLTPTPFGRKTRTNTHSRCGGPCA